MRCFRNNTHEIKIKMRGQEEVKNKKNRQNWHIPENLYENNIFILSTLTDVKELHCQIC